MALCLRSAKAILVACLLLMAVVDSGVAYAFGPNPSLLAPRGWPNTAFVAQRLNYIVYAPAFSPSRPLPQAELMRLVWYHAERGDFPKNYVQTKPFDAPPGHFDDFVTRSAARRFVRTLLGQDLQLWYSLDKYDNPTIVGDKLGWWYDTGNTMSDTPFVRITSLNRTGGRSVRVSFRIFHHWGNLSNSPPLLQIGVGSATLGRAGSNWIITSWRVDRNKHWQ